MQALRYRIFGLREVEELEKLLEMNIPQIKSKDENTEVPRKEINNSKPKRR